MTLISPVLLSFAVAGRGYSYPLAASCASEIDERWESLAALSGYRSRMRKGVPLNGPSLEAYIEKVDASARRCAEHGMQYYDVELFLRGYVYEESFNCGKGSVTDRVALFAFLK